MNEPARRFYAALSRTNGAIVRIRDPHALLQEICAICVDHGHAKMAYIVMAGENGYARPVASAGPAREFLADIEIQLDPNLAGGDGPIARTIQEGRPYIANDLHADPTTLPWRERAQRLGSKATAAFPIRRNGNVVGALSLHVAHKDFFDAPLVELMCEMVGDISYALDNIDGEAKRLEAVRQMESGFERFRKIFDATPAATVIWTLDEGRLLDANDAFCAFSGYSREALIGRTDAELKAWREEPERMAYMERLRNEHRVREYETRLRVASGQLRDVLLSAELIDFLDQRCVLTIISDITERKAYESRIEHLATHDGLTDLPNRNLFHDRITQAISHCRRTGTLIAILFVDLDRMKVVNDGLGHGVGDLVLKAVGNRLRALMRDGDTVARFGGDEFLVLLTDLTKLADAYVVAQKLIDSFEAPYWIMGRELHITASIGVSIYPHDGRDSDTLIGNADVAMYRAKQQGRAGYQFFTSEMSAGLRRRLDLESHLRRALEADQLYLEYQPKIRLADGTISGVEALLRWKHPELGCIAPSTFIPIAEENGMIIDIGDWVLRTACAQNAEWQKEGLPLVPIAVNISARQLLQQEIVPEVANILRATGLEPRWLELEITESVIARDIEKVAAIIAQLKALRVGFAIDDFGTGYSSLSYLKRFRVDRLKIDQSFVRHVSTDIGDAAIARAVISLAKSLRLEVTAEGVETAAQCRFLRRHGCDEIQGYYFSRPVSTNQLARMLRDGTRLLQEPAEAM